MQGETEHFVSWTLPRLKMSGSRKKLPMKRALEPRNTTRASEEESPRARDLRLRSSAERRSKFTNDPHRLQNRVTFEERSKGKSRVASSPPKKRTKFIPREGPEEEDDVEDTSSPDDSEDSDHK